MYYAFVGLHYHSSHATWKSNIGTLQRVYRFTVHIVYPPYIPTLAVLLVGHYKPTKPGRQAREVSALS